MTEGIAFPNVEVSHVGLFSHTRVNPNPVNSTRVGLPYTVYIYSRGVVSLSFVVAKLLLGLLLLSILESICRARALSMMPGYSRNVERREVKNIITVRHN